MNNNPQRYKVRARLKGSDEFLEGFPVFDAEVGYPTLWRLDTHNNGKCEYNPYAFDPETIEPVALLPVHYGDLEINYCPNCGTDLDLFKYNNKYFSPQYCPDCGQRVMWTKEQKS
jgi:hypothetical protein